DFDLSTGRQGELGAKLQSADGRSDATLAAYRIVRRNLAIADPGNPGQTLPVGRQSSRGLELAFGWRPLDSLAQDGNLAWVGARLDDLTESVGGTVVSRAGNRPANTPARVCNLWLEWRPLQDWTLGAELRAVSSRQADTANTLRVPGYATLGAHLAWQAGPRTAVVLRGRN